MAVSGVGPAKIFVSYRRSDAGWPAGWLVDRLAERFGADAVFQDRHSIRPGDDFAAAIGAAVGSCSVLLALIGSAWLAVEDGRSRRLDDPQDWVRLEIEEAIRRRIRVIPVLLDGARMPMAEELPRSLHQLARRQAVTLSSASRDITRLVSTLEAALSTPMAAERSSAPTQAEAKAVADQGIHVMLANARAYADRVTSEAQARAAGLDRDARERHRQAMMTLGVYSDVDAAARVVLVASGIIGRIIEYGRGEAENIVADAQAWAKHLEHDARDRQRQVKVLAGDDSEQRVFSLACATADRAIADARDEAITMVADAQVRAENLDRDVLEKHLRAMEFARTPGGEISIARHVLSLGKEAADQVVADARHEAAGIVADAEAWVLALATWQLR